MRVTMTCVTTLSHKTQERQCVRDAWLEKFGDHSCTLVQLTISIHVTRTHYMLTSTVILALTVLSPNVIIAVHAACCIC